MTVLYLLRQLRHLFILNGRHRKNKLEWIIRKTNLKKNFSIFHTTNTTSASSQQFIMSCIICIILFPYNKFNSFDRNMFIYKKSLISTYSNAIFIPRSLAYLTSLSLWVCGLYRSIPKQSGLKIGHWKWIFLVEYREVGCTAWV